MSVRIKTVSADGFTMNYFSFGSGEKAFVILPGLSVQSVMGAADIIEAAYAPVANEFAVYVLDRRNELPPSYSVYDMAEDTAKALRALGLKEVYLFGASQGGMIALTLAARYSGLVKKLMLGSSSARITAAQFGALSQWTALAKEKDGVSLSLEMGRALYPKAVFEQYKGALEKAGESITDAQLARFITLAEGAKDFDITEELCKIECPVLSLASADDKVLPDAAQEFEKLFSGKADFESYLYHGYGHAAFDTAPDYKERLLRFALKQG